MRQTPPKGQFLRGLAHIRGDTVRPFGACFDGCIRNEPLATFLREQLQTRDEPKAEILWSNEEYKSLDYNRMNSFSSIYSP